MRRKIIGFLGIVVLGVLLWYFLKPHDYEVRFKSKALPGTINQTIKLWASSLEDVTFLEQKDLSHFSHRFKFSDSIHTYQWEIDPVNDSTMSVKAYVTDSVNSLMNRLTLPFWETNFEKRTKATVRDLMLVLNEHIDRFKVSLVGEGDILAKYCACVPLKGLQREKANGMMNYYSYLSGLMAENGVILDGQPIVEVENWNIENDSITYNFCFPIIEQDSLPQREGLVYKQLERKKALRAIYNGNYITSDRAWYALLDYAEERNILVKQEPLEIFNSNPNLGGNELEWEAEIFMPLKE